VQNASSVKLAFSSLAQAVTDWRKYIWPGVRRDALRPWLRKQFASQGIQGSHGKWAALSPVYAAWKSKRYPGKPILQASGAMMKDLLSEINEGETTARSMLYGTRIPYALYHQTGTKTKTGKRKMPARRIFDPEMSDAPGTMKGLIKMSVARGVTNYARRLGFALGATDASSAALLGRQTMRDRTSISIAEGL
jgi:phage gpG-like protein